VFNKLLSKFGYERVGGHEVKESRSMRGIITLGIGKAIWTPRDYDQLATAGYKTNSDYYSGVKLIAGAAAQIPWIVKSGPDGRELTRGAAAELRDMLDAPNERMDGSEFKYAAIASILLAGNRYIERVGPDRKEDTRPTELYVLRPNTIEIRKGTPLKPILGYHWKGKPENDPDSNWEPWEMLHQRLYHPSDDWYGMAPIEAAGYPIDIGNEASALWKKFLQKGFAAGWIKPSGEWDEAQVRRFKSGLKQREKDNEWIFGEGIEDIKPMGFDANTAGIEKAKILSKRDIAAVLSVAPEMLGDAQSKTYANFSEARRALYTEAAIPAILHLRDGLNRWLGPLFDGAYIDIDRDAIDALQEDRNTAAKRVVSLWESDVITRNEARAELKYEELDEAEGDVFYSEVTEANGSVDDPNRVPDGTEGDDPVTGNDTEANSIGSNRNRRVRTSGNDNRRSNRVSQRGFDQGHYSLKAFNLVSEESKDNYWKTIEQHREQWYADVSRRVAGRFGDERKAVQRAFVHGGEAEALRVVDAQADEWSKLYLDFYLDVAGDFGRRLLAGLKSEMYEVKFEDDVFSFAVRTWLADQGAKRVVGVGETTKDKIRRELAAGTDAGESIHQLAKRLQSLYSEFSMVRAERIARTEVISASNLGSQTAARSTNLPLEKEWIATFDDRTREAHSMAHGQRRDMDQPYIVKGQRLMFPGDGSLGASADNLIQCRCKASRCPESCTGLRAPLLSGSRIRAELDSRSSLWCSRVKLEPR
jgi:HK97 family phage portal protein